MNYRAVLVLALGLFMCGAAAADSKPELQRYATPKTRATIKRMIKAHGGMKRWTRAEAISFVRKAKLAIDPDPWILTETIERASRRLYQDWSEDGARLVSDGNEVWTVNWSKLFPPKFVAQIGFYFLNLPWITQDPGVQLEEIERGSHPASDAVYLKVAMTFTKGTGETSNDRYVLYVDPESYLLRAIEYHVSYGALLDAAFLPPKVKTIGPFYHVNDAFTDVGGMTVPTRYTVYSQDGTVSIAGEVENWSFSASFDEAKLEKPAEAVVDTSRAERRTH